MNIGNIYKFSPECCIDKKLSITFINPYNFKLSALDKDYLNVLKQFDCVYIDGILLQKMANYLYKKNYKRYSFDGNSLAPKFFSEAKERSLSVSFVGSRNGVASRAADIINNKYNNIVKNSFSGYFKSEEEKNEVIRSLNLSEMIVIGMGAPDQDEFAIKVKNKYPDKLVITCGGYFDQIVDGQNEAYYPKLINDFNLRFAYRVYKEPKRILSRYLFDYLFFYKWALNELFNKRMQ
ncbi:WecB/TagA/CpsF family glycosyltransferase [Vibrio pomeroyi]|uniref:WecB/TagA/CpsF family glycosyltransferase n=1 Tax=Vibrio pomeroyi TaxID=198832 RepID=UPI0021C28AE9|nr:WecB/TagA/CpsF family glycosyltransferase [Vibrio pomeroyi]